MDWSLIGWIYLAAVELCAFLAMGIDKAKARRQQRRIPERVLFLFPLLGGALGGTLGMYAFHHKTRHWYFKLGFPALLLLHLGAAGALLIRYYC